MRFFAYGDGLDGYHDKVSPFLFAYAKKMNVVFLDHPKTTQEYRQRFLDTMTFVDRVFPYGFRRKSRGTATPHARFEAIAIGSYLALRERPELALAQIEVGGWLTSSAFQQVIGSDGANVISKLKGRLAFVHDRLLGI